MSSVALCMMIKNDHEYLPEWLSHHRELGVDHFYLYDNESNPQYRELGDDVTIIYWDENYYFELHPPQKDPRLYIPHLMDNILVTDLITTHWPFSPERDSKQHKAYQHCLHNNKTKHTWIGFIDSDELIMVNDGNTIKDILSNYENKEIAQLLMRWRVFSSSGHLTKQPLQKEAYTQWYPDYQTKVFVRPLRVYAVRNLHNFMIYPQFITVDENMVFKDDILKHNHSSDKIWVNHYWGRSRQDFEETKLKRKGGTTLRYDEHYEAKYAFIEKRAAYHMKNLVK